MPTAVFEGGDGVGEGISFAMRATIVKGGFVTDLSHSRHSPVTESF